MNDTNAIPELCGRCNSWIIADDDTAVIETWDRAYAQMIADRQTPGVVVYTALQWLQRVNARLAAN